jgi:hypothetical protein
MINEILDAIQSISNEARRALADPELERADLLTALSVRLGQLFTVYLLYQYLRPGADRQKSRSSR